MSGRRRTRLQVLEKLTALLDDRRHIMEDRPLVVRETRSDKSVPIKEVLGEFLNAYLDSLSADRRELISRYRIVDDARNVVGVGSVGMRCWVVFMEARGLSIGPRPNCAISPTSATIIRTHVVPAE